MKKSRSGWKLVAEESREHYLCSFGGSPGAEQQACFCFGCIQSRAGPEPRIPTEVSGSLLASAGLPQRR